MNISNKNFSRQVVIGFTTALLSCANLHAEEKMGAYAGLAIGQAKAPDSCNGVDSSIGFSGTCDDSGNAWKLYAGYHFSKNIAVEMAYNNFGKAEADGTISGTQVDGSYKANGIAVFAVGILPVTDEFSILGKLGMVRWKVEGNASASGLGSVSATETGFSFAGGLGMDYKFTPTLGIRAEYEVFSNLGDEDTTGTSDVHFISIGMVFQF